MYLFIDHLYLCFFSPVPQEVNGKWVKELDGISSTRARRCARDPSEKNEDDVAPLATTAEEEEEEEDVATAAPLTATTDEEPPSAGTAAFASEAEARGPVSAPVDASAAVAVAVDPDAALAADPFDDDAETSAKTRPLLRSKTLSTAMDHVASKSTAVATKNGSRASSGKPSGAAASRQTPAVAKSGPVKVKTTGKVNLAAVVPFAVVAPAKEAGATIVERENTNPPAAAEDSAVSDQVPVKSSRVGESVPLVKTADGAKQAVLKAGVAVEEVARAPVSGETVGTPTVLESEVSLHQ